MFTKTLCKRIQFAAALLILVYKLPCMCWLLHCQPRIMQAQKYMVVPNYNTSIVVVHATIVTLASA